MKRSPSRATNRMNRGGMLVFCAVVDIRLLVLMIGVVEPNECLCRSKERTKHKSSLERAFEMSDTMETESLEINQVGPSFWENMGFISLPGPRS